MPHKCCEKTYSTCDILCQKSDFSLLLLFPFLIFVETVEKLIFITQLGYKYYKCDWLGWVRPF